MVCASTGHGQLLFGMTIYPVARKVCKGLTVSQPNQPKRWDPRANFFGGLMRARIVWFRNTEDDSFFSAAPYARLHPRTVYFYTAKFNVISHRGDVKVSTEIGHPRHAPRIIVLDFLCCFVGMFPNQCRYCCYYYIVLLLILWKLLLLLLLLIIIIIIILIFIIIIICSSYVLYVPQLWNWVNHS